MNLFQAREELFQRLKPNSYKRLVQAHIKTFPCDKLLLSLLSSHYDQIIKTTLNDDLSLFKNWNPSNSISQKNSSNSISQKNSSNTISQNNSSNTISQNNSSKSNISQINLKNLHSITNFSTYLKTFLKYYRLLYPSDISMEKFYNHIQKIDIQVNHTFFIFYHFDFVIKNPFIYFINCQILCDYLDTFDDSMSLSDFIYYFITMYQYKLLDQYIQDKNENDLKLYFKQIDDQFFIPKLVKLTLLDAQMIRENSKNYDINFLDYLHHYFKFPYSIKFIKDTDDNVQSKLISSKSVLLKPKSHLYSSFQFHISQFPIWIDCYSFLIRSTDKEEKTFYYSQPSVAYTSFYHPSFSFYEHFWIDNYCHSKKIYKNRLGHSFRIVYLDKNGQFISYHPNHYQKWAQYPTICNFLSFQSLCLDDIQSSSTLIQMIQSILIKSMTHLPPTFNLEMMSSIIMNQIPWKSETIDSNLSLLFTFISKINPMIGSFTSFHSSFVYKFKNLYFNIDNLLTLPIEYSFPEYFLLESKNEYDIYYDTCRSIFIKNCIIEFYQHIYSFSFPFESYPSLSLSIISLSTYIWKDQLIDILSNSIIDDTYFNTEIIEEGFKNVGILVQCPSYYSIINKSSDEKKRATNTLLTSVANQDDFIEFLQSIKTPLMIRTCTQLNIDQIEKDDSKNNDLGDNDLKNNDSKNNDLGDNDSENSDLENEFEDLFENDKIDEDDVLEDEEVDYETFYKDPNNEENNEENNKENNEENN